MSCHGKTHHAETEKSDFSHVYNPGVSPALLAGRMLEEGGGPVPSSNRFRRGCGAHN